MANNIQAQAGLQVSGDGVTVRGSKSVNITQAGTAFIQEVQEISTGTEVMSFGDCSDIRYCYLHNPATAATVTVSLAPVVLKPGDVMLVPPSSTTVTLQATGAVSLNKVLTEA